MIRYIPTDEDLVLYTVKDNSGMKLDIITSDAFAEDSDFPFNTPVSQSAALAKQ
jgi:hypothetical protein